MERRAATHDEARALANPLRLRILRLCLDRAMTNEELAARLGLNAGTMLHHVRLLVATGFLAPEDERRGARGAVERPYRATGKSWTLDVGEEEGSGKTNVGTLALIDAFRAEVAESPPEYQVTGARLGVRLTAGAARCVPGAARGADPRPQGRRRPGGRAVRVLRRHAPPRGVASGPEDAPASLDHTTDGPDVLPHARVTMSRARQRVRLRPAPNLALGRPPWRP